MGDWLAAADALIHSTVGLTVLEAIIRGCPVISYGWGRGHIRANNHAYRRFGLAEVATDARRARRRPAASARPSARAGPLAHADSECGGGDPGDGGAMNFDTGCEAASRTAPATTREQADDEDRAAQRRGAPVLAADDGATTTTGTTIWKARTIGATRVAGRRCRADISLSGGQRAGRRGQRRDADGDGPALVGQLAGHELRGERGHAVGGARATRRPAGRPRAGAARRAPAPQRRGRPRR